MAIYIYEHSCRISRGLTNQLIMLIAAIRYVESQRRPEDTCAFCIGSFYTDIRDQTKTVSFNEIMDLSPLSDRFPYICFLDYHNQHIKNLTLGKEAVSLHGILSRRVYPCTIFASGQDTLLYSWTDGIVRKLQAWYPWDLESEDVLSLLKSISFRVTVQRDELLVHQRIHLVHLRNEPDAIRWWSKKNGMSPDSFERLLHKKYLQCIRIFLPRTEPVIVITGRAENNPVLNTLQCDGYHILQCQKTHSDRELSALEDLAFAEKYARNGIFIGCKKGSTFSACLLETRVRFLTSVHMDLDNIKSTVSIHKIELRG